MKKNSGITLMSLIVTIIILLILAGVSIRSLTGSKGLINQAKETKTAAEIQGIEEQIELAKVKAELKSNDVTMEIIIQQLINDGVISDEAQVNQDTGDITFDDFVLEAKLADYVITPEEKYYGNKNTVVTNPTYFTFTVDEEKGTATITGVKDEYAVKAYQDGEATDYTVVIKDGDTYIKDVVIPYEYVDESGKKYTVTAIGWKAFYGVTGTDVTNVDERFTSFVLPNTIKSIGSSAFFNCSSLSKINIPDGVINIYNRAFEACSSLSSVSIPDSVTMIQYNIFAGCTSLSRVLLGKRMTSIPGGAFKDCTSLSNLIIPNSVTIIDSTAFINCRNLTKINIPDGVTRIGSYAFSGCTSLSDIKLPDSLDTIQGYAFNMCTNLSSVKIPSNVTTLGIGAFSNCRKLSSIEIPSNVTSIGSQAFSGCTSLSDINVSAENTIYSSEAGILYDKNKTMVISCPEGKSGEVTISSSVTDIGEKAFQNCKNLSSVNIPESVTGIGSYAFINCIILDSINIPNSVTTIEIQAFYGCVKLKSVYFEHTEAPTFGSQCFYKVSGTPTTFYFRNATVANSFTTDYYNVGLGQKSENYDW